MTNQLPNVEAAYVAPEKLTGYLLSKTHRNGRGKAIFFEHFGYTVENGISRMSSSTMINDLDLVALTKPLPEHRLASGDIGTVVMVHGEQDGFTVEFMTFDGRTVAVVTLDADLVRPLGATEISNARQVA